MPSSLFALWVTVYLVTALIAYAFTRHAALSLIVPGVFQGALAVFVRGLFAVGALP